ncbi:hypothetical protein T265_00932 [Opisthorchis viverrini]|uniref:Uncharacterized protein n=1 Tax=Opisthorchis viverrini TaxID=6198 RepID=A0A075A4Q3_OPIVI|nr:hypothetical protein T265_00932 [Opisthorchis viverrini]KER33247.1 hypothetical protein T265_00932 [Opisthorchis viverrini]
MSHVTRVLFFTLYLGLLDGASIKSIQYQQEGPSVRITQKSILPGTVILPLPKSTGCVETRVVIVSGQTQQQGNPPTSQGDDFRAAARGAADQPVADAVPVDQVNIMSPVGQQGQQPGVEGNAALDQSQSQARPLEPTAGNAQVAAPGLVDQPVGQPNPMDQTNIAAPVDQQAQMALEAPAALDQAQTQAGPLAVPGDGAQPAIQPVPANQPVNQPDQGNIAPTFN